MRNFPITVLLVLFSLKGFSQEMFSSNKGFLPGQLIIVITVDTTSVRYELFNHWYTDSYAELRQIRIPKDGLNEFNKNNDSIKIELQKGYVKLIDKKYGLSKKIKPKNLGTHASTMRKISFAHKVSSEHKNIMHFDLYSHEDLMLEEEQFQKKVIENLNEIITMQLKMIRALF